MAIENNKSPFPADEINPAVSVQNTHGAAEQAVGWGVNPLEVLVEVVEGLDLPLAVVKAIEEQENKS
jgi:hypothetical protein